MPRVRSLVGVETRHCDICNADRELQVYESWAVVRGLGPFSPHKDKHRKLECPVCGYQLLLNVS